MPNGEIYRRQIGLKLLVSDQGKLSIDLIQFCRIAKIFPLIGEFLFSHIPLGRRVINYNNSNETMVR